VKPAAAAWPATIMKARTETTSKMDFLCFCNLAPPFYSFLVPRHMISDREPKRKSVLSSDVGQKLAQVGQKKVRATCRKYAYLWE
jgi:hypothetical protein